MGVAQIRVLVRQGLTHARLVLLVEQKMVIV
jgi:hypothetical protein